MQGELVKLSEGYEAFKTELEKLGFDGDSGSDAYVAVVKGTALGNVKIIKRRILGKIPARLASPELLESIFFILYAMKKKGYDTEILKDFDFEHGFEVISQEFASFAFQPSVKNDYIRTTVKNVSIAVPCELFYDMLKGTFVNWLLAECIDNVAGTTANEAPLMEQAAGWFILWSRYIERLEKESKDDSSE